MTKVLATMAATIAAGLLQRVYTDRDGHQQPAHDLTVVPGLAEELAADILERCEAATEYTAPPAPTSIPGPGAGGAR